MSSNDKFMNWDNLGTALVTGGKIFGKNFLQEALCL